MGIFYAHTLDIGGCLYVSYCVLFGVDYRLVAAYMAAAFCCLSHK